MWRVFWVPQDAVRTGIRRRVLAGWEDLPAREDRTGVRAGDPIFLSPDYRVDPVLGLYVHSAGFRRYTAETRRNYATDIALLLTFLWGRGRSWADAVERDLEDYEHWRRFAAGNPNRVGGSKWDRELAAFTSLYGWAARNGHVTRNPVAMRRVRGRNGEAVTAPAARAKDARPSSVHWLTPRTWRRWIDVGLRGHGRDGVAEPGWAGRLEDRNVAFARLLVSSGLRRAEGGSLLTFEVPELRLDGGRYYRGKVAAGVTRSKKDRTFYAAADAVGEIGAYAESSRAWAVARAQRKGLYERLPGLRLVTGVTRQVKPVVRWRGMDGAAGQCPLSELTARERMLLFTEGPHGLEPLWLWLNERGMPFGVHSWDGVFTTANKRCERVLTPAGRTGLDPHRVHAPYATVHSARHSFALYMLVVLNVLMDQKYGLSQEERREYRLLYGDPWFMVQQLLGHASRDTTVERYLAPVADLNLRSMLAGAAEPAAAPMPELDAVFARVARESEGIQDLGDLCQGAARRCLVTGRGRRAALPEAGHARPEYLVADGQGGLVVRHCNRAGRVREYDFTALPAAGPMQASLAALFAACCTPGRWTVHGTSSGWWLALRQFAEFLASRPRPPRDLDELTPELVRQWKEGGPWAGGREARARVCGLLREDARLQTGPVADELARRRKVRRGQVQSYSEAEFDRIRAAARHQFRGALQRIGDNALRLRRWREGAFAEDSRDWVIGEALDILARTGDLPRDTARNGELKSRYRSAFGAAKGAVTWQRLFLTGDEAAGLGVLLVAEFGWNLSVIGGLEVPRASPDQGDDGHPVYRVPLEKPRRGPGRYHETRNVADDGAGSPGRLITQALQATRFARAVVEELAPGTDRLIVWRASPSGVYPRKDLDRRPPVGPFRFGISPDAAKKWAAARGLAGSPFRRGRRTVIALDRREPAQHSQETHDRVYVLPDQRVQAEAAEVIAAGAEDAADRCRKAVLAAQLRERPVPGDVETVTADCSAYHDSPWPTPGGCRATFLTCLACPSARVHPGHHPRLAHLHEALASLRSVLPPAAWAADWRDAHDRLQDLRQRVGEGPWAQALAQVTDADRELVSHLLTGSLDT